MPEPVNASVRGAADCFSSFDECIEVLTQRYPTDTFHHLGIDPDSRETVSVDIPRFLFRGERTYFRESESSIARMKRTTEPRLGGAIEAITLCAARELGNLLKLGDMAAAGFCQHYGLPTELLDFTSNLTIACGFAAETRPDDPVNRRAQIAVLDLLPVISRCIIADLTTLLADAHRPVKQCAYGFHHRTHTDLKTPTCVSDLGIRWYEIATSSDDARRHELPSDLLDPHQDKVAGLLQLILDDLSQHGESWPDPLAQFFAQGLSLGLVVIDKAGRLQALDRIGFQIDEKTERARNRRIWSRDFPDTPGDRPLR